jgi:hypothetical protein
MRAELKEVDPPNVRVDNQVEKRKEEEAKRNV